MKIIYAIILGFLTIMNVLTNYQNYWGVKALVFMTGFIVGTLLWEGFMTQRDARRKHNNS